MFVGIHWEPRDMWVGMYWDRKVRAVSYARDPEYPQDMDVWRTAWVEETHVFLCLVPCVVLHWVFPK